MSQVRTHEVPSSPAGPARRFAVRRFLPFVIGAIAATTTFAFAHPDGSGDVSTLRSTVKLLGADVPVDAHAADRLRAALRAHLRGKITLRLGEIRRTMTREAAGVRIDEVRLSALARALVDPASPILRNASRAPDVPLALAPPLLLDEKAALAAISSLKDDLDEPAQDAKIDLVARKVLPEIAGRRIKVFETLATIEDALRTGGEVVDVAYEEVPAQVTRADLKDVDLSTTLGYFETRYATDKKNEDRTFNLRLAASRLNGKVILPGETFDFNAVVGPRDEAHGYRLAKVIADGELVDGIGGGTCQITGTLHGAAFFAGLEVVQRTPHTRPSSYIKMGLDAAVAYPHVTLKLRNPFPHPVVLKETVAGGVVRAEILGPKRPRMVTFIRKIDEVLPFTEREVKDDRLPKGVRVVTQRGIPGFKVRRYRIVREGPNAIREKSIDKYPPTQQIVHVGTGVDAEGGSKPKQDNHPEYVADEYLAITQGPGIGKAVGDAPGMEEVRVAGPTGTKGWSRKHTTGSVTEIEAEDDEEAPKPDGASGPPKKIAKAGKKK